MFPSYILYVKPILTYLDFTLTKLVDMGQNQVLFLIRLGLCVHTGPCMILLLQPRESLCIINGEQWLSKDYTKQVQPVHMAIYMRILEIGLYQKKPLSQTNNTV